MMRNAVAIALGLMACALDEPGLIVIIPNSAAARAGNALPS